MESTIKEFVEWVNDQGWEIKIQNGLTNKLPDHISTRYKKIPEDYLLFLRLIDSLISSDEKTWFLSIKDFNSTSDLAFCWNEFESMSLEAAEGDEKWKKDIIKFWNRYLPIVMSVRNDYEYYAIDTESPSGAIVYGFEPEFEEVETVADSFSHFLNLIMTNEIEL